MAFTAVMLNSKQKTTPPREGKGRRRGNYINLWARVSQKLSLITPAKTFYRPVGSNHLHAFRNVLEWGLGSIGTSEQDH